jgi:hypothetical protein
VINVESTTQEIYEKTPALYDKIADSKWIGMYDTEFVSYGSVTLVVDEYRSWIVNATQTGKPQGWPVVNASTIAEWNAGTMTRKLNETVASQEMSRTLLKRLTDTGSSSKNWVRIDLLSGFGTATTFAHVSHAFVEKIGAQPSKVQASLTFLIIVIVCNVVKLSTMLWVLFVEGKDYLVTLGDGAASFLEDQDETTERMCLLSKQIIAREVAAASFKHNDNLQRIVMDSQMTWTHRTITYSNARNRDREVGTYLL